MSPKQNNDLAVKPCITPMYVPTEKKAQLAKLDTAEAGATDYTEHREAAACPPVTVPLGDRWAISPSHPLMLTPVVLLHVEPLETRRKNSNRLCRRREKWATTRRGASNK